jgi:hypothetical protein
MNEFKVRNILDVLFAEEGMRDLIVDLSCGIGLKEKSIFYKFMPSFFVKSGYAPNLEIAERMCDALEKWGFIVWNKRSKSFQLNSDSEELKMLDGFMIRMCRKDEEK